MKSSSDSGIRGISYSRLCRLSYSGVMRSSYSRNTIPSYNIHNEKMVLLRNRTCYYSGIRGVSSSGTIIFVFVLESDEFTIWNKTICCFFWNQIMFFFWDKTLSSEIIRDLNRETRLKVRLRAGGPPGPL